MLHNYFHHLFYNFRMSSSCIHITALLFRVEAANRSGMTNPACTSRLCVWNVPPEKTVIKPKKIADMNWKSSKLNKEPSRPTVDSRRSLFQPVEKKMALDDNERRRSFYKNLKDTFPDSCFVLMGQAECTPEPLQPISTTRESTILSSDEIDAIEEITVGSAEYEAWHQQRGNRITASNVYRVLNKVDSVSQAECSPEPLQPISTARASNILSSDEIDAIEKITVGQADNEAWHQQREGRITASNFYRVFTKVESMKVSKENSADKLVDSLLGKAKPPTNLPALKYGRDMELIAVEEFIKYFKKHHKDVRYRQCGIFIDKNKQYLGASPDLLIECSCCGEAVVEIKSPFSIANEIPSARNLSYLCMCNGQVALKEQHQYFAQVQGEMAITKRPLCYFFVYTRKGYHLETIRFNATYWHRLEENLTWFYSNCLSSALKLLQK